MRAISPEWEDLRVVGSTVLRHPKPGTAAAWIHEAISPGLKGKERAREKVRNDYDGDCSNLKDLVRFTLEFENCKQMLIGLRRLRLLFTVVTLKNKYANPTPMGYRDLNLCLEVPISNGNKHICEVQLNLTSMLRAKDQTHEQYEVARSVLPEICKGSSMDWEKLFSFIMQRLSASSADGIVELLAGKSQGLFMHARPRRSLALPLLRVFKDRVRMNQLIERRSR
jgi:hypothetical protein